MLLKTSCVCLEISRSWLAEVIQRILTEIDAIWLIATGSLFLWGNNLLTKFSIYIFLPQSRIEKDRGNLTFLKMYKKVKICKKDHLFMVQKSLHYIYMHVHKCI